MNSIARTAVKLAFENTGCSQIIARRYSEIPPDVQGLSKKTVDVPTHGVGFPCASKDGTYKNPEYFSYSNMSFFEAEVELMKYRLPQPSNKTKK